MQVSDRRETRLVEIALGGTPSGGGMCVVGRCWEAYSSWVPVPLFGLSSS